MLGMSIAHNLRAMLCMCRALDMLWEWTNKECVQMVMDVLESVMEVI